MVEDIIIGSFQEWRREPVLLTEGVVMVCLEGKATLTINFQTWQLTPGAVITLFPNEGVKLDSDEAFLAQALVFSASTLRESSLSLESAVYDSLRRDRCRTDSAKITEIVQSMFRLLGYYKELATPESFQRIVMYQLRVFFLGFADYIKYHPVKQGEQTGSRRMHELFSVFMRLLESDFREHHDVTYYADQMSITTKYLNNVVQNIAHQTTKELIDSYIIMQLKLALHTSGMSISQLAWQYKFSSLSFFTHYFKQHTGLTPKEYMAVTSEMSW